VEALGARGELGIVAELPLFLFTPCSGRVVSRFGVSFVSFLGCASTPLCLLIIVAGERRRSGISVVTRPHAT